MVRSCVFDLDGTLINTLDDLAFATNQALADNNLPIHDSDTLRSYVGDGVGRLVWRAAPEGSSQELLDRLLDRFFEVYEREMLVRSRPYPGIMDLLETLQLSGIPMAVLSNKMHSATERICDHFFPDIFDVVLGHKEENLLKPAPDGLFQICQKMKVEPQEGLYFGDSIIDIKTAQAVSMPVLACSWGYTGRKGLQSKGADAVISVPEEALPIIFSPSTKKG